MGVAGKQGRSSQVRADDHDTQIQALLLEEAAALAVGKSLLDVASSASAKTRAESKLRIADEQIHHADIFDFGLELLPTDQLALKRRRVRIAR